MAYDPARGELSSEDASFLTALHERFLKARLAKVPENSVLGHLLGKILEEAERRGLSWRHLVVTHLPTTVETARRAFGLTPADERAIEYSRAQSAHYITDMAARLQREVREAVTTSLSEREPPKHLAQRLFQRLGEANRDWRRIALTEAATAVSNGYLASLPEETWVVGDTSVDCCDWCRQHLQGRAFRLLAETPEAPTEEQSISCVWPGKTNIGRSRFEYRAGGLKREPHELWHPCIPAHPHCRCRWRRFIPSVEEIEPGTNRVVPKQSS